jgi:hypothetical protein
VPERYPSTVEHVRRQVAEREPAGRLRLAFPARHGQEERDAAAAGHVVHDVRERHVLRAYRDAGSRPDADRGLDDRLAVGELAGRRLVRAVAVTGVGPLAQQHPAVLREQEIDVHHDPPALRRSH